MTMLHFIIGPPKSGKSKYAEQLISRARGSVLYMGTLPNNHYYIDTIREHQRRRPADWGLVELIGNPRRDLGTIGASLAEHENILLDGITIYIIRLMTLINEDFNALLGPAISLLSLSANRAGDVVIVDPPVPKFLPLNQRHVLQNIHAVIVSKAQTVTWVQHNTAIPLASEEVTIIDGPALDGC